MKRPFALFGFTLFFAVLTLFFIGRADTAFLLLVIFSLLLVISLLFKRIRQESSLPIVLVSAVVSCLLFLAFGNDKAFVQSLEGKGVRVEARVYEAPYRKSINSRYYVVCSLKSVDGKRTRGKLRLSFLPEEDGIAPDSLEIGNRISFTGRVYVPGEGDERIERYFAAENILLGAYNPEGVTVSEPDIRGIGYAFQKIRTFVAQRLSFYFSDNVAGVLVGILTGDKSCLDTEVYNSFRESGIAHIMAVSGLHLSVWVFFLGSFHGAEGRFSKLRYILLIFVTVFIMLLAGMSESVKRAGFMSLVYLLGKVGKRKSDSLNNLGIAVSVLIAVNPACVMSVSLQLSFLSTLSILTLGRAYMKKVRELLGGEKINTPLRKLMRLCFNSFCISISVLVFTFPVLIYAFRGISAVSAFVNILLIPVVTPLLVLTGVFVIFSSVSFLALPFGFIVKMMTEYVIFVSSVFTGLKNAFLLFEYETLPLYICAFLIVALFSFLMLCKKPKGKKLVGFCCLVLCTALIFVYEKNEGSNKLRLETVNGESVCLFETKEKAVLFGDLPSYEKGILLSSLEERDKQLCFIADGDLSLTDVVNGSRITLEKEERQLFDGVGIAAEGEDTVILCDFNKILISRSTQLQQKKNYDIIINISKDGEGELFCCGKSFFLSAEGSLVLSLGKNSVNYVRGENSWQNLMKSS